MGDMLKLIWWAVIGLFRRRALLEAEILTLAHQLNVLRGRLPKRLAFSNFDRLIFASPYRITPRVVNVLLIVEPETVIRWHRAGFRWFLRWKSRCRGGRQKVPLDEIRRECLDHGVVFGERHLRHILLAYMQEYIGARTYLSLTKDAPRAV
jgi:hypothetical protein